MTKTLTEQWRNGTLEQRYYYVKYFGNGQKPFVEIELKNFLLDLVKVKDSDKIGVLAPVPSYDEYKRLQEQLAIATKALKEYARGDSDAGNDCLYEMPAPSLAQQALKEIEGVK